MYAIIAFLIYQVDFKYNEKQFLVKCFCNMSFICVILALFFRYDFEGRLTICVNGMYPEDPNQFCGYFIPGILSSLYYLFKNKKGTLLNILLIGTYMYFAFLTGSRGGLIAIAFGGLVALFIVDEKNSVIKKVGKLLLILAVALIVTYLIVKILPDNIIARYSISDVTETGGTGRLDIWKFYFNYYSNSELFRKVMGNGAATNGYIYRVAHNMWIDALLETGVFGLVLYLIITTECLKLYYKNNRMIFAIYVAYIALSMSLSLFAYKPIWVIFILSLVLKECSNEFIGEGKLNEQKENTHL